MGGINAKLMQGIDDAENQMQKEKQPPKSEEPVKKEEKNKDIQKAAGKPRTTKEQPKVKKNTTMRKKMIISLIRCKRSRCFLLGQSCLT